MNEHAALPRLPAVAIIGTIAAGKTTIAESLSVILHEKGLRHALLDLDWLGQVYPPPDPHDPFSLSLAFRNLKLIVPNFIDQGARCFVTALTLTSQEDLEALQEAIPQVHLTVCLLTSSPATRATRISSRDTGHLREDFLERTDALAEQIESAGLHDLHLSNDGKPARDVAAELLDSLGWGRRG